MSKAISVLGSMHTCPMYSGSTPHVGGVITGVCATGVTIDGQPIALQGDMCACTGAVDTIVQGSAGVFIDGVPVVTVGCMTAHGGQVTTGITGVTISANIANDTVTLPVSKIPSEKTSTVANILTALSGNSNKQALENQQKLREETQGEPRVYNLQWKKEETVIRDSKVLKIVTLTADTQNIPNGETATILMEIPETINSPEKTIELSATVTEKKMIFEWEIENLEETNNL